MLPLRARILIGAGLWTLGLVLCSFVLIAWVFRFHPAMPALGREGQIHFIWGSHAAFIVFVAAVLMVVGALSVRRGLAGITHLRVQLGAVREGREPRVRGRYVAEVQPLVDDLNALLEHREQAVRRALAKAGDLAHGLKTPLSILATEADRAAGLGQAELAEAIDQQVQRMQRQVNYHLAHARAAASGATSGGVSTVCDSAAALVRALARLYSDRSLPIEMNVPATHTVRVQREDLDEMLGNLLDNACKWTKTRVAITSSAEKGAVHIAVEDDGPGILVEAREAVLLRGVRADQRAPGNGLGLSIVRELAELYGGSVTLGESNLGGLRATLTLPGAARLN